MEHNNDEQGLVELLKRSQTKVSDKVLSLQAEEMLELADQLVVLSEEKEKVEEREAKLKAAIKDVNNKLCAAMGNTQMQNFTRAGKTFYLRTGLNASAVGGMSETLYASMKANGYGGMVKETVHQKTLTSFVREQLEENEGALPEWLKGLVSTFEDTKVGMRKASRK